MCYEPEVLIQIEPAVSILKVENLMFQLFFSQPIPHDQSSPGIRRWTHGRPYGYWTHTKRIPYGQTASRSRGVSPIDNVGQPRILA